MQYQPHIYAILPPYLCNVIHISMQYYHHIYAICMAPLCVDEVAIRSLATRISGNQHGNEYIIQHTRTKKQNTSYILSEDLLVVAVVYCVHVK